MKKTYVIIVTLIKTIISTLIIIASVVIINIYFNDVYKNIFLYITLGVLGLAYFILLASFLNLLSYQFKVDDDTLYVYHGVITRKVEYYPIRRIQHIVYNQNVLGKVYNIASVDVVTGGGAGHIKVIELEKAVYLTDLMSNALNRKLDDEE